MKVFISYSSEDIKFVEKLALALIQNRRGVWLDRWEMRPGDTLLNKIQEGINEATYLVMVLSKRSVIKPWCQKELNAGLMRELEEKKVFVIPVLIEDCEKPLFLKEKIHADFRRDFEIGFKELKRALPLDQSDHMGRGSNEEFIVDWALHYGIGEDDCFYTDIDIANWYQKDKKTILIQIKVKGCKNITERFKKEDMWGLGFAMKERLISIMYASPELRKTNILASSDKADIRKFKIKDKRLNWEFEIIIRTVLMGVDTENDVIINLFDTLKMFYDNRDDMMKPVTEAVFEDE